MQARDVMTTEIVSVGLETSVQEIAQILVERSISAVPVVDDESRLVGIVSEGDLMRRAESETERHPSWWLSIVASPEEKAREYIKTHGRHAKEVMTKDVITVGEDMALEEIATLLERNRIKRVPVTSDGKLVGIVSRANLLHGLVARGAAPAASADDREIREKFAEALKEAGLRTEYIDVVVADGVLQLWGSVVSKEELDAVRVAAENVDGVKGVENHVSILSQILRPGLYA